MALPVRPTEALTIIPQYNVNPYDESTNPYGFDNGGHIYNHLQSFRYVVQIENYLTALTGYVEGLRQDVADDLTDTNQDVTDTAAARDRARQFANAPEDQDLGDGEFSARHFMEKTKDQLPLATAQADRSKTEADRAAANAAGVNLPAVTAADAGKVLGVKADGTGFETIFGASIFRVARTANTALVKADIGKLIDITAGTFSQTFAAATVLGNGWYAYLRNAGTGDVTLDPNGSETIDGLASFVMYPGEARLIQCDGTALRSIVLTAFSKTFISSATFIKPPGYSWFGGLIRSGGASGAVLGANENVYGGAGGGSFPFTIPAEKVSASQSVIVGAGGASVTSSPASGNVGGDSSFAGIIVGQNDYSSGGAVLKSLPRSESRSKTVDFGASDPGGVNAQSLYGGGTTNPNAGQQGSSLFGGGAGGTLTSSDGLRAPGASVFSGSGGVASATGPASAGAIPSGGGGASRSGFASGAGARGQVEIYGVV